MQEENKPILNYSLDKLLTSELRFFIMTLLAMYEEADFNFLKKELGATDGNLSVQLRKLEEADYLTAHKEFVERKPRTTYAITKKGLEKLQKHLDTISAYQKIIEK